MSAYGRGSDQGAYYPAVLDVRGRRCVVVGGGGVAERKARALLEAGANELLLVAPMLTAGIRDMAASGRIVLARRPYEESDLDGAWIVFACTDNEELNASIALAADRLRIWCNVGDHAASGSLIAPSTVRRGDLLLAVTASGASPALAMAIKRELERQYGPRYEKAVDRLRSLREHALNEQRDDSIRRSVLALAAEDAMSDNKEAEVLEIALWYQDLLERMTGRLGQ